MGITKDIGSKTYLLFNLKSVNDRSKLTEDIIGPLVEFKLCRNQVRKIPQRLGCIKNLITPCQQSRPHETQKG